MAKANTYPVRTLANVYGEDVSGNFGKATQIPLPLSVANGGSNAISASAAAKNLSLPYVLAQSAVQNSVSTPNVETILATVTVPAGLMGANGRIRITALYSYTNSANTKTFHFRISDGTNTMVLLSTTATTTTALRAQIEMANRNATNSQVSQPNGLLATGTTAGSITTGTMDTTLPLTITITGTPPASGGDAINLEEYLVEVFQSAGN